MKPIRLSAFTIFLILLAVILIGFVLHHTWESFKGNREGFHTDYSDTTIASTELWGQYSQDNTKIAKLTTNLYFDPVAKVLIEKFDNVLYMKRRDGSDFSYNTNTTDRIVTDLSMGDISFNGMLSIVPLEMNWSDKTVADAKSYFKDMSDNRVIYMDIAIPATSTLSNDTDRINASSAVTMYYTANTSVASTRASYPTVVSTSNLFRKYERTLAPKGMAVSSASTAPVNSFGWFTKNGYGVVTIPVIRNDAQTNTTFIHVMDIKNNKHVAAFYFSGNAVELYNFTNVPIVTTGTIPGATTPSSSSVPGFEGDIKDLTLPYNASGENLHVDVRYDAVNKLVYIAGKVGDDVFRAYITISSDFIPVIAKSESGSGSGTTSSANTSSANTSSVNTSISRTSSSNTNSSSTNTNGDLTDITKTLHLIKTMQSIFGSQDSNYLLKTEVVPPVCPTCPSCSSSPGVCSNCGGNGGCGTKLPDEKSIIKNGVDGVTDIGRDAVSGTLNLGKEVVKGAVDVVAGTGNFLKDTGSGIGQFAKDSGSGIGQFAKDSVSGLYGATKEIGSGAYGATKDVVGGTVGLGREIIGGVLQDHRQQGYQNSYGGPQFSAGNQGGYLQPQYAGTHGQDPYSYYGAVPQKDAAGKTFLPRTADFSSFRR